MDVQESRQLQSTLVRHYEKLEQQQMNPSQQQNAGNPGQLDMLRQQNVNCSGNMQVESSQVVNRREAEISLLGEQSGLRAGQLQLTGREQMVNWQYVTDENDQLVRVPDERFVAYSTFDEAMRVPTCCGQKENEQTYREQIKRIFDNLKQVMPEYDGEEDFLSLVNDKRLIAANSEAYNRVLKAAERFHRRLLRGDLEEEELALAAVDLRQACAGYIAGHPEPSFESGKRRLRLIGSLKKKAEKVIWDERVRSGVAELSGERIRACEDGNARWMQLADIVESMIRSWNGQGDGPLVSSIKRCMLKGREQFAEKYLHYLFPEEPLSNLRKDKDAQKWYLERTDISRFAPRIKRFMAALGETMGDIVYWAQTLEAETVSEVQLTGSDLHERGIGVVIATFMSKTGVQTRVLKPEEKWAEYGLLRATPDEEAIQGQESLAEYLNGLAKAKQIAVVQPDGTLKALESEIRTIKMQVARGHGTMVEMVEHVREGDLSTLARNRIIEERGENNISDNELKEKIVEFVDADQVLMSQLFCMLVGMADMHIENFVFEQFDTENGAKYRSVMIDADNALSKRVLGRTNAGGQCEQIKNFLVGQTIVIESVQELKAKIMGTLSGVTLRTVPVITKDLDAFRMNIQRYERTSEMLQRLERIEPDDLIRVIGNTPNGNAPAAEELREMPAREEEDEQEDITPAEREAREEKAEAERELREMLAEAQMISFRDKLLEGLERELTNAEMRPEWQKEALICAIKDFISGQIPFYEFHPDSGTVTTHRGFVKIATAKTVEALIEPVMQAVRPENAASVASQLIRPPQQE